MIFGIYLGLLFISFFFFKVQTPGNLTGCMADFTCLWFDHLMELVLVTKRFCSKFYLPVKTSYCYPLAENINEPPVSCAVIKLNLQTTSQLRGQVTEINILEPFQGVLDRFTQIKPKVIFSVEAVRYNNKIHDHLEKLTQVVKSKSAISIVLFYSISTSWNLSLNLILS